MQRRIYEDQDHPLTQYLNSLIEFLNEVTDGTLILKTKEVVLPYACDGWEKRMYLQNYWSDAVEEVVSGGFLIENVSSMRMERHGERALCGHGGMRGEAQ